MSDKTKHTPGPWAYRAMKGYCSQLDGANGHTICCFDEDPNEADEKLIASAPELLDALELIANTGMDARQCMLTARAAIAKATGEPA